MKYFPTLEISFCYSLQQFDGAVSFNRDISPWNITSLSDMEEMFQGAESFSQDLCPWGSLLPAQHNLTNHAFLGSGCMDQSDPDVTASPPGPFCFACA